MNAIVAVTQNWGIGCKGKLLHSIPADMRHFKSLTEGKIVVMGHETFKSLPGCRPLSNRLNIVLSANKALTIEGATICNCLNELENFLQTQNSNDVFVIGGQAVYEQLLEKCTHAYITKIHTQATADTFFPNIDALPQWQLENESALEYYEGVSYRFCTYVQRREE